MPNKSKDKIGQLVTFQLTIIRGLRPDENRRLDEHNIYFSGDAQLTFRPLGVPYPRKIQTDKTIFFIYVLWV